MKPSVSQPMPAPAQSLANRNERERGGIELSTAVHGNKMPRQRTKLTPDIVDLQNKTSLLLYLCGVGVLVFIIWVAGAQIPTEIGMKILNFNLPVIQSIYEANNKNLFTYRDISLLLTTFIISIFIGSILIGRRLYLESTNECKTRTNVLGLIVTAGFLFTFILILFCINFNPSAIYGFNPRYGIIFNCALLSVLIGSGLFMTGEFLVQSYGVLRMWFGRR
jgi:hypothetical protein